MNPYEQYRNVSLTMATPGRLIVRLYDRAIQDIEARGRRSEAETRSGQDSSSNMRRRSCPSSWALWI